MAILGQGISGIDAADQEVERSVEVARQYAFDRPAAVILVRPVELQRLIAADLVAAKAAITGFLRQRGAELTRGAVGNDRRRDRSKIGLETGAEGSAGRCLQVRKTGAIERPLEIGRAHA